MRGLMDNSCRFNSSPKIDPGHNSARADRKTDIPLVVDLDGSLIDTDLLVESVLFLLHRKPWLVLMLPFWLLRGKAQFKKLIASKFELDAKTLPYNRSLLDWVHRQADSRPVILSTASDALIANQVAAFIGIFDSVIASDGTTNNVGRRKASVLVERFGERGFDYVGNAWTDLHVWMRARNAIVVSDSGRLATKASKVSTVTATFPGTPANLKTWTKALRIHQWSKNLLIFVPVLAAHVTGADLIMRAVLAFVVFGMCASGAYLLNDLLDLQADRRHHTKRKRPFAAGSLPLLGGLALVPLLSVGALALGCLVGTKFVLVLGCYFLLTLSYSLYLKQKIMLDVIALAGLYTLRILAGGAATDITPSFWLLVFSMFTFLSLAMLKRYTELVILRAAGDISSRGRGYRVDDLPLIQSLGGASGYLSVLVLALYIDSTTSHVLYRHPQVLWLVCPIILYWISRAWIMAHRGTMHDDPVIFALKDRTSQLLIFAAALIVFCAI